MKFDHLHKLTISLFLSFSLMYSACGTIVGNPRKPTSGGDTEQNPTAVADLPELDFTIPAEVSGIDSPAGNLMLWDSSTELVQTTALGYLRVPTALQDPEDSDSTVVNEQKWEAKNADGDILRHHMRHAVGTMIGVNVAIRILGKVQQLKDKGYYKGLGKGGLGSGIVESIEDDSNFSHRLLVCHADKPYLQLKWDETSKKIAATVLLRRTIDLPKEKQFFTSLVINPGAKKELVVKVSGVPPALDPKRRGDKHVAAYRIHKLADNTLQYRTVSSWYSEVTDGNFPASRYISASSSAKGVGEVAGWVQGCPNEFDETNTDRPGWCFGRKINAQAGFEKGDLRLAIERLRAVGIEPKSSLEEVDFDDEAKCPE